MRTKIKLIVLILITILSYNCYDTLVNGGTDPRDYFPDTHGTWWIYKVTDSLASSTDTVTVTVNGKTTISGGAEVTIWVLAFSDSADTNYVQFTGDSVKIYQEREYLIENIKFVFPLSQGKNWTGDFVFDNSYVAAVTSTTVPAGTFSDVYLIEREYGGFNEYRRMTIWFVHNVGIIKIHMKEIGLGFQNELWELTGYTIN